MSSFPLTDAQTALWLHHVFLPDKPICNTGQLVSLNAPINPSLFADALNSALEEADALRIRLGIASGVPFQRVVGFERAPLEIMDFSSESDPTKAALAWIEREFWTNIPWQTFPLFRFVLVKTANDRYLWLQKHHHIIVDATGAELLTRRVIQFYEALTGGHSPPPSAGAPFHTFVESERDYRNSERFNEDQEYWLDRFSDLPTPLISGDRVNSERSRSGRPARLSFHVEKEVWDTLEAAAKLYKSTTFRAVIALIYIALRRLYGVENIGLGVPLTGRTGKFKETIGLFSHVMPFRLQVHGDASFHSTLIRVGELISRDYTHRRFPVTALTKQLQARHGRIPLYDIIVNYVPTEYALNFVGSPLSAKNLSRGFFSPWAIEITDYGSRGLDVAVTYDQGLISLREAKRLAKHLEFDLRNRIGCGDQPIVSL